MINVKNVKSGEVFNASVDDAVKAMSRLQTIREQRSFLISLLGEYRQACKTLRIHKQRAEVQAKAEIARLQVELMVAQKNADDWKIIAERAFSTAKRNAALLAKERSRRGE